MVARCCGPKGTDMTISDGRTIRQVAPDLPSPAPPLPPLGQEEDAQALADMHDRLAELHRRVELHRSYRHLTGALIGTANIRSGESGNAGISS